MEESNEIYEKFVSYEQFVSIVEEGLKPLDELVPRVVQRIELLEMQLEEAQAKAKAYDRLISGWKKTPKEVANFLGNPIAMDRGGAWYEYKSIPSIGEGDCEDMWVSGLAGNDYARSISLQIDFSGHWNDSLTLPDGWEFPLTHEWQLSRME